MKKKLITLIILCAISSSMFGCTNDYKKNDNSTNQTQQSADNKTSAEDDYNDNEESQINYTNESDKNESTPKLSSEQLVKRYEELRPKVTNFLKDKLEKPNEGKGEAFKVYEKFNKHDVAGYNGIESLSYDDGDNTEKHFTNATFGINFDPETHKKSEEICGHLMQILTIEEFDKNGLKIEGTLFEDYMHLFVTEKIDFKSLEEEVKKNFKTTNTVTRTYGNTKFIFSKSSACLVCTVSIK